MGTRARIVITGPNLTLLPYKTFVSLIARRHEIKGFIRDLSTTQVELFCELETEKLDPFINMLNIRAAKDEPLGFQVDELELHREGEPGFCEPRERLGLFEVKWSDNRDADRELQLLSTIMLGRKLKAIEEVHADVRTELKHLKSEIIKVLKELKELSNSVKELGGELRRERRREKRNTLFQGYG